MRRHQAAAACVGTPHGKADLAMSPERWHRIQDALHGALECAPHDREAFLAGACLGDPDLLAEVRSLLSACAAADTFLNDDPVPTGAGTAEIPESAHSSDGLSGSALPPDPSIAHYRVTGKLGEGGMGVVYEARDTRLDRTVALKLLPAHLVADADAKAGMLREARAAAALDHVNICTIHDIGETDEGQIFIAMACYAGETLERMLRQGPLPIVEALDFAVQIAHGLAGAHERGIVHRDVKPANIMVTPEGAGAASPRLLKLLDFGLAKAVHANTAKGGPVMGTVAYMSPEQARGEAVDHRTDIWSLGVVLHEMLVGRRPFRGPDRKAIFDALLSDPVPRLTAVPDPLRAALEPILCRALARPLQERYEDVRDLIVDLRRVQVEASGTPASGPPAFSRMTRPPWRTATGQRLPEGERIQATVVVSHIDTPETRATSDAERLEPSVDRIKDHAAEIVTRHGGSIHHMAGREIVAIFGLPAPREDDCVRACRSALELHSRAELGIRSGIDTGRIVAQRIGKAAPGYRIAGIPLDTAAVLALHAEAGEVLVSPESRRLLTPSFETMSRAPLPPNGRTAAITPARVLGPSGIRSLFDGTDRAGLSAYRGRIEELETLRRCGRESAAGNGRFIAVSGEAGAGKSRLLHEFRHNLEPGEATVLQGRCSPHAPVSFLPFTDALREHFGIGADTAADGVEQVVAGIREATPELALYVPLYLHLLSIPSEAHPLPERLAGEDLRRALVEALAAIFTLSARHRPLVLLLEDWHWSDVASRMVLHQIVELVPAHALLVVVTYRPDYDAAWSQATHLTQVRLGPLEVTASVEIMKSVLHADHIPDEVGALLHERSGGNPFFVEEICQALRDEGTLRVEARRVIPTRSLDGSQLPNTVQAVLRTRLHRLDRDVRSVLLLASVIGRVFTRGLLRHSLAEDADLDASLEALRATGLIHQTHILPEPTYRFKHVLTQEVAYDSILQHQRRQLHGLVGGALERDCGDRLTEHAEVLAHHFGESQDWRKAAHYSCIAGSRARHFGEFGEALARYRQARSWLAQLPEDAAGLSARVEILLLEEQLHDMMGRWQEQQACIDESLLLLAGGDHPARLTEIHIRQADLHTLHGRFGAADAALGHALRISRAHADAPGEQKALRSIGFLRWHENRYEDAIAISEELLVLDRRRGDTDVLVTDLLNLLTAVRRLPDSGRGAAYVEEVLGLGEQIGDPVRQVPICNNVAEYYRSTGDREKALLHVDRAIEIGEASPHLGARPHTYALRAQILLEEGRLEECVPLYRAVVEAHRSDAHALGRLVAPAYTSGAGGVGWPLRMLGEVLVMLERYDEAVPCLDEAATYYRDRGDPDAEALLRSRVATIRETQGQFDAAHSEWDRVRELRRAAGDDAGECDALEALGRTARRLDDPGRAPACYERALQLAGQIDDTARQGSLHNTLGILARQRGARADALAHYEEALRLFRRRDEPVNAGLMLACIGVTLDELNRPVEAIPRLEEAVLMNRLAGQRQMEAHALAALGDARFALRMYDEAAFCHSASLGLRRDLGDRRGEGWMLQRLARTCAARGDTLHARDYAAAAAVIGADPGNEELMEACRRLPC